MSPAAFDVALSIAPDAVTLTLSGELDLCTLPSLQRALEAAEASGAPRVLVDLAALDFIDSSGIVALVRAAQRGRESGRQVEALRASGTVARAVAAADVRELLPLAA